MKIILVMGVCHSDSISKRKKRISKLFGKKKNPAENKDKALQTIQNLDQQLKDLELKIDHYDKQAQNLTNEAKAKLKAGDKAGAKKLLTKKKRFVEQIKQLEGAQNMMEEQRMMLENQDSMKKIFETVSSTNQTIKEIGKGVSVEEIEKAREDMEEMKDAQKEMGDFFAEYADAGNEEVDEELNQLEAEVAKEEVNLPDANKEKVIQVPAAKEDIKKEEDALGDFLA